MPRKTIVSLQDALDEIAYLQRSNARLRTVLIAAAPVDEKAKYLVLADCIRDLQAGDESALDRLRDWETLTYIEQDAYRDRARDLLMAAADGTTTGSA